jgi:Ni/Fe-hydrogenase subunit HybB-like protein
MTVLYIEFLPIVTERFIGRVNLPGPLARLNDLVDRLLRLLDRTLSKTMFVFIIAGVVLSTLHQSSLGTLMVIAGPKMHPLWQTPVLPLLFLLSAVSVGFPMVIFESLIAARSFGLKPEMQVLGRLGRMVAPILGIYLAFKLGDLFIRETFVYLTSFTLQSVMYVCEIVFGIVVPMRMFMTPSVQKSPLALFIAAALVVGGVLLNRVDSFIVAYSPPYSYGPYFPSFGEISVTVGFVSILVLLYRAAVMIFPVISLPDKAMMPSTKYSVRG